MPFIRTQRRYTRRLLKSYAWRETSFEVAYAEDFGRNDVLRLLEERKALSGLHYILEVVGTIQGR